MSELDIHQLLYGEDPDERLVSVYMKYGGDKNAANETVVCVYRDAEDKITTTEEKFYPFIFASAECVRKYGQSHSKMFGGIRKLEGPGLYNHLIWFHNYKAYRAFTNTVKERHQRYWDYFKMVGTVETQFLMQRGKTLFKGMSFNDMKRLAVDIEVYSPDGFPTPERCDAPIIMIALKDNRGFTKVMHVKTPQPIPHLEFTHEFADEEAMLRAFFKFVRRHDPDVIEGHNFYKFDLPYIAGRANLYGIKTKMGRDNYGELRFWNSKFRAAEKEIQYPSCDIRGRHVIDTYFAALSHDVFRRDMENYQLKYLATYFDVADENRVYVDGDEIATTWDEDPYKLLQYAGGDVQETMAISEELSAATFYLTQMVPHSYGKVARSGQSAKIEPLFLREYLRQRHAVPQPEEGHQDSGGYANIFYRGVVGPILYADVESLYPSIMLNYNIQPESEDLGLFQPLLRQLTKLRFHWKKKMKDYEKGTEGYRKYEGMQSSVKIVINAFYGNLSTANFSFNDYSEGERVATTGQELLKGIIDCIHDDGGLVIECDTDGVMFIPPDQVKMGSRKSEMKYIDSLTERAPDGIIVGHDGSYERMVSFRTKNYVLREKPDSKPKFKGSALKSRGNEGFVNFFVRQAFILLLDEDVQGIRDLFMECRRALVQKKYPILALAVTKTLKKSLNEYEDGVTLGGKNRMAQYEVAYQMVERGLTVQPGDRVTYYIQSGHPKNARAWEKARWVNDFDDDADTTHYLRRLDAAMRKIEPMFTPIDFSSLVEVNTGLFPVVMSDIKIPFTKIEDEDDHTERETTDEGGQATD
jgi:DNA polymerase elongation subunit (family B)